MPVEFRDRMTLPVTFEVATDAVGSQLLGATDRGTLSLCHIDAADNDTELSVNHDAQTFCFVRSGTLRCLTTDDALLAELGAGEGIVIPSGTEYRCVAVASDEGGAAEYLQFQVREASS